MSIEDLKLLGDIMCSEQQPHMFTEDQSAAMDRLRAAFNAGIAAQAVPAMKAQLKADQLVTRRDVECELATKSLSYFIRKAWDVVEPAYPYIHNWHIDAIAAHLEAVTRGQIRRLLINIPPGHAKSLLVSVLWPAWVWIQPEGGPGGPKWRSIYASYSAELSLRDSIKCRMLIESEWYQQLFQPTWRLSEVQNAKGNFMNSMMGFRLATSVGGRGTGFRGDCVVADDPLNAKEAHSAAAREEVIHWWDHVMSSRLNQKSTGAMVIIMQRLHERDLSGHVLEKGSYEHLCLPTRYEPERRSVTCLGADPREDVGELLFPQLFPDRVVDEIETKELGASGFAGQHQQRPSPEGGGILKKFWWRYWQPKGAKLSPVMIRMESGEVKPIEAVELPVTVEELCQASGFDQVLQSWDCAFKDLNSSDYVVGQVWAKKGADKFLLDRVRDRMDCPQTIQAIVKLSQKWPHAQLKLVEDKANGSAVIQMLRQRLAGMVAVEPEGGKVARAYAVSPQIESGNVYLPHPSLVPWVDSLIEECAAFPNGAFDDQVDSLTQALNRLVNTPTPRIRSFNDPYEES